MDRRTISQALRDLPKNKGQVFWPSAHEHAHEIGVSLHEGRIHGGPWHVDDGLNKRRVYAFQAGHNVREGDDPQAKLGSWGWGIGDNLRDLSWVKLIHKLVEGIADSLESILVRAISK